MLRRITAVLLVLAVLLSCLCVAEAKTYKTLKKGSKGVSVKTMQRALKKQGYYHELYTRQYEEEATAQIFSQ